MGIFTTREQRMQATYRAATNGTVAFTKSATVPFLVIGGSATRITAVERVVISTPTLTAAAYLEIVVKKTSAAPTGGTLSDGVAAGANALTLVAMGSGTNSIFKAATATVKAYSAGPTAGAAIGIIDCRRFLASPTTAAAGQQEVVFDWRSLGRLIPPMLEGTAETLSFFFAVVSATDMTMAYAVELTEFNA